MPYPRSEPFSSVDIPDEVWEANAAEWRAAQAKHDDLLGEPPAPAPSQPSFSDQIKAFQTLMQDPREEGRRNDVYLDSRGFPTVGIGHLVKPGDNLRVGQRISDAQVGEFFQNDGGQALRAAQRQAAEAGIDDPDFIRRLAAVTFQLGEAKWPGTFPKTWAMIRSGDYPGAAKELYNSDWAKQTPRRVAAFRDALLRLPPRPTR